MPELHSKLLEVSSKELIDFDVEDMFNGNRLTGFICRRSDHRYGAMVIETINGEYEPQIIYATPKLNYPFDRAGNYNWPPIDELEVYEKLDGTNILSYHYYLGDKRFTTFKTRLTPVVKDMSFGAFGSMLKEYMNENPWVRDVIDQFPDYHLSFELYGSRNPITIKYDTPLEMSILFGVNRVTASVVPPRHLHLKGQVKIPLYMEMDHSRPTDFYNALRAQMSQRNAEALYVEGMVFYVRNNKQWHMFKCKPEEIEKIHWTASGSIPRASIWTTVLNAFESYENPTVEDVNELLREEYDEHLLTRNTVRIQKLYDEGVAYAKLVARANEVWARAKEKGLDVTQDKSATMRFISQYFDKDTMRKVASVILQQAGLQQKKK